MALTLDLTEWEFVDSVDAQDSTKEEELEFVEPTDAQGLTNEAADCFVCRRCRRHAGVADAFPLGRCDCLQCRRCLVEHAEGLLSQALAALKLPQGTPATSAATAPGPAPGASLALPLRGLPCPACGLAEGLDRGDVVELCGEALRALEEATAEAKLGSLVRCPSCGAGVELTSGDAELPEGLRPSGIPEFDRTLPRRFVQNDLEGRPLSREALLHRECHRFRCTCRADFCNACRATPYHLGYTCEAWEERRMRPDCHFCTDKATSLDVLLALAPDPGARASSSGTAEASTVEDVHDPLARLRQVVRAAPLRALRAELRNMGLAAVDSCVERGDIETLACSVHVCSAPSCRERLSGSCLRALPCGHFCSGCRGEPSCPPCLTCRGCTTGISCPFCAEPLPPGPSVSLSCGHAVHAACLARRLGVSEKSGWQPPEGPLSFDFRRCPVCRARIEDLSWPQDVALALRRASELEAEVTTRAVKRLKVDPRHRRDEQILPGGAFDGRPRDYALTLYQYHVCEECRKPYFGGERRCEPAAPPEGGGASGSRGSQARRLCGGCAALKAGKVCPEGHDASFVEWKCQRCCSVAVWFCWGTTHFCDRCHDNVNRPAVPCTGPAQCPWGGRHPPNGSGEAFCLGCSLCRHRDIT